MSANHSPKGPCERYHYATKTRDPRRGETAGETGEGPETDTTHLGNTRPFVDPRVQIRTKGPTQHRSNAWRVSSKAPKYYHIRASIFSFFFARYSNTPMQKGSARALRGHGRRRAGRATARRPGNERIERQLAAIIHPVRRREFRVVARPGTNTTGWWWHRWWHRPAKQHG